MLGSILRSVAVRNSTTLSQRQLVHNLPKKLASSVNCRRNPRRIGCRKVWTLPSSLLSTTAGSSLFQRGVVNLRSDMGGVEGSSGGAGEAAARSSHKHTNRLAKEQSPYLLQHAHNPVDWYPWGNEAFAKARAEDKPIFLSVGYSTCHWCHVMEVESFENEQVAKLMNDMFVNIKVDREERPDVDKVYMTYVQATQGGGGWPMSVFLTPELKPIVGGTYFPPDDKYGRPGFKTVLRRVDEVWKEKKDSLREAGDQVVQQLADASTANSSSQDLPEGTAQQAVQLCASQLAKGFDPKLGGFGGPPKFPRPVEIMLMFQRYKRLEQSGIRETAASKALEMALFTLRCMARGGMHDHIGGGFHRYSVDEHWHVPHFEKMLYDQGQLVNVYLDAFAITKDAQYALVARDVLDYLRRDMTHPDGGIFSAEDADSAESENSSKKKEGSFYVWTEQEIETVLGNNQTLAAFEVHYYVKSGGNCDLSRISDPHDEFSGKNVLIDRKGLAKSAAKLGLAENLLEEILGQARQDLHAYREKRPRPHLDDKVIVAWNGLAISAFARASRILKVEPQGLKYYFPVTGCDCREYLVCAERVAEFIRTKLYNGERLCRSYREEPSAAPGFMDDYAFLIAGLLDLYEAGGNTQWLAWAIDLQAAQDDQFLDKVGGGYYSAPEGDSSIIFRVKEDYDGAEPSGNSVAAINLQRLASLVGDDKSELYLRTAEHLLAVFEPRIKDVAMAVPLMCCAFDLFAGQSKRQVIIAGVKRAPDTEALVNAAHSVYDPDKIILQIDATNAQDREFWQIHNSDALAMARMSREGKAIAYVCQNFSCLAPIEDPQGLEQTLRQPPSAPKVTTFKLGSTAK